MIELYVKETETVNIANKHEELQNFASNFEYKADLTLPAIYKKIEQISHSEELANAVKQTNEIFEKENKVDKTYITNAISKFIETENICKRSDEITEERKLPTFFSIRVENHGKFLNDPKNNLNSKVNYKYDPYTSNSFIRSIVISGLDWVVNINPSKDDETQDEDNDTFQQILEALGNKQTSIISGKESKKFKSDEKYKLFAEMAIDVVKNIFGVDAYINIPHAIGLPVKFNVEFTTFCLLFNASQDIEKNPYTILISILLDRDLPNTTYYYNEKADPDNNFLIFTTDINRYGNMRTSPYITNRQYLKQTIGMVTTSNMPISAELSLKNDKKINLKNNTEEFLVEGALCTKHPNFAYLCMANVAPIRDKIQKYKYTFYIALIISIILIMYIAKSIANDVISPVKELIHGMEETKKENYSYRISLNRYDELGILCNSFDNMMKGLEERLLIRKMLSDTAQKITLENKATESDRSDCVMIYVSIQKFNEYLNTMSPNNLLADLKKQVANISKIVLEEGGELDKIIGDKILIAFHVNNQRDLTQSIFASCKTALRIMRAESIGNLPFPVAIGINAGSVVTGFLGVGEKRDFTIIGDPVNVSARISAYAETQRFERCLMSDNVYEIAKNNFGGKFIGEITLKGKSQPMKVYHLVKDNRIQS